MKIRIRLAAAAAFVMAASAIASGSATALPEHATAATPVGTRIEVVKIATINRDFTITGTDIYDCYYDGGYRGCSTWHSASNIFQVCDEMQDGRYTKGRIAAPSYLFDWTSPPVRGGSCEYWGINLPEGTFIQIRTGVEGLGWTWWESGSV